MMSMGKNMVKELLGAFPGIDEAMSFAEVMRYVEHRTFKVSSIKNLLKTSSSREIFLHFATPYK